MPSSQTPPPDHGTPAGSSTEPKTPRDPLNQILFLPRLRKIIHAQREPRRLLLDLHLYLTDLNLPAESEDDVPTRPDMTIYNRRISKEDVRAAIGGDVKDAVCYICGPPAMTDELVAAARDVIGEVKKERVFCEKWW